MNREINKYTNKLTDKQITKKRKKACNDTYFVNLDPPIYTQQQFWGDWARKASQQNSPKTARHDVKENSCFSV